MDKKSKIYVAGHIGLVGQAILDELKLKGYKNIVVRQSKELDLRDQLKTERFFSKEKPEFVFLAAGKVGGILANSTYTAEFIYDNIMIAANIINAAYKYKVKKLLNLGSACIYPRLCPQPMKEEYFLTGPLEPTNEAYAVAKIAAIKLCRYYNQQYGTNFISVMPTNLYGPRDHFNLETAHLIPSIMRKLHLAKLLSSNDYIAIRRDLLKFPLGFGVDKKINLRSNESISKILRGIGITAKGVVLWGSGNSYREFLYVQDLASACIFLMERYGYKEIGEFINIGTGKELKIKEIARLIKEVVGFQGEIVWDKSKPDGMPRKLLDNSRINKLGWKPKVTLEQGLRNTYAWFKGE